MSENSNSLCGCGCSPLFRFLAYDKSYLLGREKKTKKKKKKKKKKKVKSQNHNTVPLDSKETLQTSIQLYYYFTTLKKKHSVYYN